MVDEEVENTLREIRERVRNAAEFQADQSVAVISSAPNGDSNAGNQSATKTAETMARIDSYLTTTARAWDRLPPLVSQRSGGLARLELWVKRRFKKATHWYAWEQINFNAAVHHALRDTLDTLQDLKQQLAQLRAESGSQCAALESQRAEMEAHREEMEAHRAQIEVEQRARSLEVHARLADLARELSERDRRRIEEQRVWLKQLSLEISETAVLLEKKQIEMMTLRAEIASQRAALDSQGEGMEAHQAQMEAEQRARGLELNTHLANLALELRERDGQRLEEQRVCFRQLSLEMSEAEVLLDRARRDLESRLDKLESQKRKS